MDARQKQQYLAEYQVLKEQGKPFFPYAVLKDSAMAVIVLVLIIVLSIVLGAQLGPKADPVTTAYDPRPEWYFFFLFQLLRIIRQPPIIVLATIGIPTIWLIMLLLLPFFDRGPERHPLRRPIATLAGIVTIATMAYLTVAGALAGPPGQVSLPTAPQYQAGKEVFANAGCQGCHKIGIDGNPGPGPNLTHIGSRLPKDAIARTLVNPTAPMPSFVRLKDENPKQFDELTSYMASLK
jgi:menaquinol-cytochrome c reductase cytochrome b/c subunit